MGRGGRGDLFGDGVGVGIAAASCGWTGSARRTSGSADDGAGIAGVVTTATVAVGDANSGAAEVTAGALVSIGEARGATMLSETVAVAIGELPGAGLGAGLSRCI